MNFQARSQKNGNRSGIINNSCIQTALRFCKHPCLIRGLILDQDQK